MVSDVEHYFKMWLLAIFMSSLGKCLLKYSVFNWTIWLFFMFFWILSYVICLYILDINQLQHLQKFSPIPQVVFSNFPLLCKSL